MTLSQRSVLASLAFIALNLLFWFHARELAEVLAPLVKHLCNLCSSHIEVLSVRIEQPKREWLFLIEATNPTAVAYPDRLLPAGTPLRSSTLAGHLFQPWIIGLSLLPFLRWGSAGVLLLRLAVLVVLLSSVMAADVPLILLGAIEDTLLHYLDRAGTTNSPLVLWMNFMNGGGRLVLPLLAFGLTALPGASAPGSVRAAAERSQI